MGVKSLLELSSLIFLVLNMKSQNLCRGFEERLQTQASISHPPHFCPLSIIKGIFDPVFVIKSLKNVFIGENSWSISIDVCVNEK